MEGEILSAHQSDLVPTAVVRLPQLIGVRVINPLWKLIYDSVLSGKKAHWVGDSKVPRSFLDVEDAARAMVLLAENDQSQGRVWNIAGPEAITGSQFIEFAFRAMGREPKIGSWGRGVFLTGALSSEAREMTHMPYDYYSSFVLEGNEFAETFPSFRFATPDESVSKGIEWYRDRVTARK
jgi:nucleoside-diphosphate-sugar epimerase